MPNIMQPFTLSDHALSDAQIKALKLPLLCYNTQRPRYEIPMAALAYLPIQQKDCPVYSIASTAKMLTEFRLARMTVLPKDFDIAKCYQSELALPLAEQLMQTVLAQLDTYKKTLQGIQTGNRRILARLSLSSRPLAPSDHNKITSVLSQLATMRLRFERLQQECDSQGDFLGYPSYTLPTVEHWLIDIEHYLNNVRAQFDQARCYSWTTEQQQQRQMIDHQIMRAEQRVLSLRKQLHHAIWMRLQVASNLQDPTLNAVYSHLRHTASEGLSQAHAMTLSLIQSLQPEGSVCLIRPHYWKSQPSVDMDQATFIALNKIIQHSPYRASMPLLNCYWLQVDDGAAIAMQVVQHRTGWLVPTVLSTWVPNEPRWPRWLFYSYHFAYQLPTQYGFTFALINGLVKRLKDSMSPLNFAGLQLIMKHPSLQILSQISAVLRYTRLRLKAQQHHVFWRWGFRLINERRTCCIDALLKMCDELEQQYVYAYYLKFVSQACSYFETQDYAPALEDQNLFASYFKKLYENPLQDQAYIERLQQRWQTIVSRHPRLLCSTLQSDYEPCFKTSLAKPVLSACNTVIEADMTVGQANQKSAMTLETLMETDPDLKLAVEGLGDMREKTQCLEEKISALLKKQSDLSVVECSLTATDAPRLLTSLSTALSILEKPSSIMATALKDLLTGHVLGTDSDHLHPISFSALMSYYQTVWNNNDTRQSSEKYYLQAALTVLQHRMHQAMNLLAQHDKSIDDGDEDNWSIYCQWLTQASQLLQKFIASELLNQWQYRTEKLLYRYVHSMLDAIATQKEEVVHYAMRQKKIEFDRLNVLLQAFGNMQDKRLWSRITQILLTNDSIAATKHFQKIKRTLKLLLQHRRFNKHCYRFMFYSNEQLQQSTMSTQLKSSKQQHIDACHRYLVMQQKVAQDIKGSHAWTDLFKNTQAQLKNNIWGKQVLHAVQVEYQYDLFST